MPHIWLHNNKFISFNSIAVLILRFSKAMFYISLAMLGLAVQALYSLACSFTLCSLFKFIFTSSEPTSWPLP